MTKHSSPHHPNTQYDFPTWSDFSERDGHRFYCQKDWHEGDDGFVHYDDWSGRECEDAIDASDE